VNSVKGDTLQYLLTLVDEILTVDESKATLFLHLREENQTLPFTPLFRSLTPGEDLYLVSKACRVLAILLIKAPYASPDDVQNVFRWIQGQMRSKTGPELTTALSTLQILLRRDEFRVLFFKDEGLHVLAGLLKTKGEVSNFQVLYQTTFCLWLLSYNASLAEQFATDNVVHKLVDVVKSISKDKVMRMAVATLRNLIDKGRNNEQMVEANLLREVDRLLQKKFPDEDLVTDLEALHQMLVKEVAELSSFDIYKQELFSGTLEWTPVHRSEKFWRENCPRFEENDNRPLVTLIDILKTSSDLTTLSVACFDLGEFVRFHTRGRALVQGFGGKVAIMRLMEQNQNPEVQKHALLALQKMMVNNWEYLSR